MRLFWVGATSAFVIGSLLGFVLVSGRNREDTTPAMPTPPLVLMGNGSRPQPASASDAGDAPEAEAAERELLQAERQGLVQLETRGVDLASVRLHLQSNMARPLRLTVEAGTVFDPIDQPSVQSMVVVQRRVISLPALAKDECEVATACLHMHLQTPTAHHRFRGNSSRASGDLARLLAVPGFSDQPATVRQYAIWTLTDNPAPDQYARVVLSLFATPGMGAHALPAETQSEVGDWLSRAGIRTERYALFRGKKTASPAEPWQDLAERLSDDSPTIRCQAVEALSELPRSDQAVQWLGGCLADTGEVSRGWPIYQKYRREGASPLSIGQIAADTLGRWGEWRRLVAALASPQGALRAHAAGGLAQAPVQCEPALLAVARDPLPEVRAEVARSLTAIALKPRDSKAARVSPRTVETLAGLLADSEPEVRRAVVRQLAHPANLRQNLSAVRGLTVPVMEILHRDRWYEAAQFLGRVQAGEAVPVLASITRDDDRQLRRAAIDALGTIGTAAAQDALRAIAEAPAADPDHASERTTAHRWLERIAKDRSKPG